MPLPMYPSREELLAALLAESGVFPGGALDQNTASAVARLQQPGARPLTPDPARQPVPVQASAPVQAPAALPGLVAGSVPASKPFETSAGVPAPGQGVADSVRQTFGGMDWRQVLGAIGAILVGAGGRPDIAANFIQMQKQQAQQAETGRMLAGLDTSNPAQALQQINALLGSGRVRDESTLRYLLTQRDAITQRQRQATALSALGGGEASKRLQAAARLVEAFGDKAGPLITQLFPQDQWQVHSTPEGATFLFNSRTSEVAPVPPQLVATGAFKAVPGLGERLNQELTRFGNPAEIVRRAVGGDPDARRIYDQALQLATKPKPGQANERDLVVADITGGRYKSEEELLASGDQQAIAKVRRALEQQKVTLSERTGYAGAVARNQAEEEQRNRTPLAFVEGFKAARVLDTTTGQEVNASMVTQGDFQKERGRYKIINSQDQVKTLDNLNVLENLAGFYRDFAPQLAQPGAETAIQRGRAFIERTFGYPGVGTIIAAFAPTRLALGKIFQGAGAQLSDRDVEAASGLELKPGDSQQSLMLKAAALEAFANLTRASLAGNKELAKRALAQWNQERERLLSAGLGAKGGLFGVRTQSGAIIPPGVRR